MIGWVACATEAGKPGSNPGRARTENLNTGTSGLSSPVLGARKQFASWIATSAVHQYSLPCGLRRWVSEDGRRRPLETLQSDYNETLFD